MESIKPDAGLIVEQGLTTPCSTCAYLRKSVFKKTSRSHGRIIWWCKKKKYLGSTGLHFGTGLSHRFTTCDEHETKEERRKANDTIRNRILEGTTSKRVLEKSW